MIRSNNMALRWALGVGMFASLGWACKTNNINATTDNEADSFNIGPNAQDLIGPDEVEIDVPANAVTMTTQVTLSVEATGFPEMPAGTTSAGHVFSFEPAGQTFAQPLTFKIPYTASGSGTPTLLTAEDTDTTWTIVASTSIATSSGTFLTGTTTHFSFYTVVMGSGASEGDSGADAVATEPDGGLPTDSGGGGGDGSGGSSGGGDAGSFDATHDGGASAPDSGAGPG